MCIRDRKKAIAEILLEEGYIKNFQIINDGAQGVIRVTLKYSGNDKVISGLRRVSKPGLRVYAGADELPQVLKGLGIAIISTSRGVDVYKRQVSNLTVRRAQAEPARVLSALLTTRTAVLHLLRSREITASLSIRS